MWGLHCASCFFSSSWWIFETTPWTCMVPILQMRTLKCWKDVIWNDTCTQGACIQRPCAYPLSYSQSSHMLIHTHFLFFWPQFFDGSEKSCWFSFISSPLLSEQQGLKKKKKNTLKKPGSSMLDWRPSFFKDIFLGYRTLSWQFFFLSAF